MSYNSELSKFRKLSAFSQREYVLKMVERLKYSPKYYTEKELIRILNPEFTKICFKIVDIAKGNPEISLIEIMEILKSWGWVKIYNGYYYTNDAGIYNYITPIIKNGRLVTINEDLVMGSLTAGILQEYLFEKIGITDSEQRRERSRAIYNDKNQVLT